MKSSFMKYERRYLTQFDTLEVPQRITEVLVIGSGVAGLRAAIEAAERAKVLVIAKDELAETTTSYAQGGVAIVTDPEDSIACHVADTVRTGKGLTDEAAARSIIADGPKMLEDLNEWGFFFDTTEGCYDLGQEGGHCMKRVLRAHGDNTGAEIQNALIDRIREHPNIRVMENAFAIDLLSENGRCHGALVWDDRRGKQIIWAGSVVLATGGSGRLFRETTNPRLSTGDGLAMAFRAGAVLRDLEFFQFHPTTLYVAGAARALISEALRGEGAILMTRDGRAFMKEYHPDAELAPRDVVSRAIVTEMKKTGDTSVYLDFSGLREKRIKERFEHLAKLCDSFDLDLYEDLIPVRPSAHYQIGGLRTDLSGATSVERLYAAGEVASTGLHGANRLASNSLLEGFVMGRRAGSAAAEVALTATRDQEVVPKFMEITFDKYRQHHIILEDMTASLRSLMWRACGVEREGERLGDALKEMGYWSRYVLDREFNKPAGWQLQNMILIAAMITRAALERTESRGVHFRTDHPETDDEKWKRHSETSIEILETSEK